MPHTDSNLPSSRPLGFRQATLLLAALPALATAAPPGATVPDGLEVGVTAYHYLYKEPGLMQLEGPKVGVRGSYSRTDGSGKSGRIEAGASYGRLDYESNGTGTSDNHDDTSFEARLLFGMDFGVRGGPALMPYTGLGYRYLYNDLRGTSSTGASGYRRESNYFYLPIGVIARAGMLVGNLEVDYLIRGHQKSYLSDAGFGDPDIRNDQNNGFGARASLMIDTGRFAFGPWFSYWRIQDSNWVPINSTTIGQEPLNRTTEVGLELRYRY
jgi:hypothetical protein